MNAIQQTIEIPENRRLFLEVPREIPVGQVILTFTPVSVRPERPAERDVLARRTGFLEGQVSVPPDFDTMGQKEIIAMFEGSE
jgi:hypothetical protein